MDEDDCGHQATRGYNEEVDNMALHECTDRGGRMNRRQATKWRAKDRKVWKMQKRAVLAKSHGGNRRLRQKLISLARRYHAKTRMVYENEHTD